MSLWHMDWKQLPDSRWWIAAEDDASRLIVGYGVFQEATAENTIHVLKQAIDKHGRPRELLTDRGSQFYANEGERREKGISQFETYLAEQGIKHILCRINHPQTNGKLERFYGVYEQKQHQFKSIDEFPHCTSKPLTPIQDLCRKTSTARKRAIQTIQIYCSAPNIYQSVYLCPPSMKGG
jgi:putative transposase